MRVAALAYQQSLPDLKALAKLVDVVEWVSTESAGQHPFPLVVCGLMAVEQPQEFKQIVLERLNSGLGVLLIPRIRPFPADLLLETPEAVEVTPAEFKEVVFKNRTYRVAGSLVFVTALHAGKLATLPGRGVQILAYRPSTAKGSIILCGASLTSFRPGTNPSDQRLLLEKLLVMLQPVFNPEPEKTRGQKFSAEEMLSFCSEGMALVLLARVVGAGHTLEEVERKLMSLGFNPDSAQIGDILRKMMPVGADEAAQILIKSGWGAYVRRVLPGYRLPRRE